MWCMKDPSGPYADIGWRLRAIREHFGMNQTEFAQAADVPYKSLSQWESGRFRISIQGALRLREKFNISLDFIYCGSLDTLPMKMANALSSSPLLKNSSRSTVRGED